ncbi:MAG: ferritin family protein [bacterium]
MKIDYSGDEVRIYDFDPVECYRIARRLERESVDLYTALKEKASDADVKETLGFLLAEEKNHLETFESEIAKRSTGNDDVETVADAADSKVVSPLANAGNLGEILCDRREALKPGVSLEKRSIAFYMSLLGNTAGDDVRRALKRIIAEEKNHLKKFRALLI